LGDQVQGLRMGLTTLLGQLAGAPTAVSQCSAES
jgi:hypothetical protein